MKCNRRISVVGPVSRSPHGERGLKFLRRTQDQRQTLSLPARGAWVEIPQPGYDIARKRRSPHGERGLKSTIPTSNPPLLSSLPARGAWVEIYCEGEEDRDAQVAPRTGSVG